MKRIMALDSVRGIAALVVVLYHCSLVVPHLHDRLERTYVLRPFIAGPQAVYIFFVLSGFVLYGVLNSESALAYSNYAAKRLVRLWLPVVAAVIGSAFLFAIIQPSTVQGASTWFAEKSWSEPLSSANFAGHLALFGGDQFHQLDNPIWSLAHEVKISLLFPFVVPLVARRPVVTLMGTTVVSVIAGITPQSEWLSDTFDPARSLYYLFLFVAGAVIADRRDLISAMVSSSRGKALTRPLLLLSLMLLCSNGLIGFGVRVSIGAVLLIGLCATSHAVAAWLKHPMLSWLGRISYSLYLVHMVVLLAIVHTLADLVPLPLLVALVVPLSLGIAEIFCRMVELPSIRLASRVALNAGRKCGVASLTPTTSPGSF